MTNIFSQNKFGADKVFKDTFPNFMANKDTLDTDTGLRSSFSYQGYPSPKQDTDETSYTIKYNEYHKKNERHTLNGMSTVEFYNPYP